MTQEAYVSFEVARLLKEKGFEQNNPDVEMYYRLSGDMSAVTGDEMYNIDSMYAAPTHQMAMAWLREIHGIHIQALCPIINFDVETTGVTYNVVISNLKNCCLAFDTELDDKEYDSYEDAVEAALKYALENLI